MKGLGLRAKVALFVSVLVVAIVGINAYMTIRTERIERESQLIDQARLFARLTSTDVVRTYGSVGIVPEVLEDRMARFFQYYPDLVRLMIISESGRVLYDSGTEPVSEPTAPVTSEPELLERMAIDGMDMRVVEAGSGRQIDILTPLSSEGPRFIKVRYVISFESMEKRLKDIRADFIVMAGFFIVAGIAVAVLLSAKLTRPILMLKEGAGEIARGNLEQSLEVAGSDEISELGRSFNSMARSLKENRDRIEKTNLELIGANEGLRRLQDELVRSERMAAVGQLAAGLSHEIDNPIGVILGFAELLYDELPEDDPRREDLSTIIAESRRCKRIVRGLLDFSRPPALGMAELDVNGLIESTVATARSQAIFRDVDIRLELGGDVPNMAADPDRLRQVFMNLLLNSVQAMQESGGVIRISTGYDRDTGSVKAVFSDTGAGIPAEDIDRIFEPFYTTKRPGEGTGLGLAICRRLLEEQGGGIEAANGPDGGAVFTVTLHEGARRPKTENLT